MAPSARTRADAIFLSYRRSDSSGHTGRLRDFLVQSRPHDKVFMDVDSISPGTDFSQVITSALQGTAVMLVVIGPGWLAVDADDNSRLDAQNDFVRIELEAALNSDVVVIPVLVRNATMPDPRRLPESLRPLATREAFELRDNRWDRDVGDLSSFLDRVLPGPARRGRRPGRMLILAALAVALAVTAAAAVLVPRWWEAQRLNAVMADLSGSVPPSATGCRVSNEPLLQGSAPEGLACDLPAGGALLRLELHRVTALAAARTPLKGLPDDRAGTCRSEPSPTGPAMHGNWGRGPFLCRAVGDTRAVTWLDEDALILGRLSAPGSGVRWSEVAEAWRQSVGATPFLTLSAALPAGLDTCKPPETPDNTAATTAELECVAPARELSSVRVGLSATRESQDRYLESFGAVATILDDPETCERVFPNRDPWRANQGESIRGRRWCFLHDVNGSKRVRTVWSDEKLLVSYVVEDQGDGPAAAQRKRVLDFWMSLIGKYPAA
jgi:TIR domain-containing protein